MIIKESDFEKKKRESQAKYKLGLFYSNPNDDRFFVPNRWGFGKCDINIAHPMLRKSLFVIGITILLLILIFEYII